MTDHRDAPFTLALAALVLIALVLGGASRDNALQDLVIRLSAVPVLAWGLLRWWRAPVGGDRLILAFIASLFALPLLQLVPLPESAWELSPAHAALAAELDALGLGGGWRPWSLTPGATFDVVLGLLPFTAVLVGTFTVPKEYREGLIVLILVVALVNVLIGALQMAGGPQSPLRFYGTGHGQWPVGFFANRNHFAAFLVVALCLVFGLLSRPRVSRSVLALSIVVMIALFAGVGLSGSRAGGAILLVVVLLGAGLLVRSHGWRGASTQTAMIAGGLVGGLAILTFGGAWLAADRFAGWSEDLRFGFWGETWRLTMAHLPFGAGGGSFPTVFQQSEQADALTRSYINQAHNDWLEVLFEYGVLILLPVLGVSILIYRASLVSFDEMSAFWLLGILSVVLHSLVDYPLRTPAVTSVLAVLVAQMLTGVSLRRRYPGSRD